MVIKLLAYWPYRLLDLLLSVLLHLCQLVQAHSAGILCPMTLRITFAMTKRRLGSGPVPSLYTEEHAGFRRRFPRITSQFKPASVLCNAVISTRVPR